jgi:hypothetical protein
MTTDVSTRPRVLAAELETARAEELRLVRRLQTNLGQS